MAIAAKIFGAANRPAHSPATVTSGAWNSFFADWIRPALDFGVPALAVFVALLLGTRLFTPLSCRPGSKGLRNATRAHRRAMFGAWLDGIVTAGWAAALLTVGLALASGGAHAWAIGWMQAVAVVALGLAVACLVAVYRTVGQTRDWRATAAICGAVVAVLVGVPLGILAATTFGRSWGAVLVTGALTAVIGTWLAARVRGLGLGLRITATGSDGKDDGGLAADVRSRLYALAADDPHGIQVTQQTDVNSLPKEAVDALPTGTPQKVLTLLVKIFTRAEPWRVQVIARADGALSVSITRNYKQVESAVITARDASLTSIDAGAQDGPATSTTTTSTQSGQIDPAKNDKAAEALRIAAAAFVLMVLAERHNHLRSGLAHATKWRSLAAQVIALDPAFGWGEQDKLALLADAVALDTANLAAQAAYLSNRYWADRSARADHDYLAALRILRNNLEGVPGTVALRLRAQFNSAAIRFNLGAAQAAQGRRKRAVRLLHSAHDDVLELRESISAATDASLHQLLEDMTPALYWVDRCIEAELERLEDPIGPACAGQDPADPVPPLAVYERACAHARTQPASAIDDLEIVVHQPGYRTYLASDPSLQPLFDLDETDPALAKRFKKLVGTPLAGSELELPPFAARKDDLAARGITSVRKIAGMRAARLSREFGISRASGQHWEDVAALYEFVQGHPGREPRDDPAPTTHLLLNSGVGSVAVLKVKLATDGVEGVQATLRRAAKAYAVLPPSAEALGLWRDVVDGPDGAVRLVGPFWVAVG